MSIALAKLITAGAPKPAHTTLVGYIDRHPSGGWGSYAVLRTAIGVEVAWDGQAYRSLPTNWRKRVEHELVSA